MWRRGTVPIWWKSELKSHVVSESQVIIRDKPYDLSQVYFSNLIDRYETPTPIYLCNMLRCGPQQEETILSEVCYCFFIYFQIFIYLCK